MSHVWNRCFGLGVLPLATWTLILLMIGWRGVFWLASVIFLASLAYGVWHWPDTWRDKDVPPSLIRRANSTSQVQQSGRD